jgi:hypothetical protein
LLRQEEETTVLMMNLVKMEARVKAITNVNVLLDGNIIIVKVSMEKG